MHRIEAIPGVTGAQVTGAKGNIIRVDIGYAPATVSSAARHIGRGNWWVPRPLRGLYGRYGIKEEYPARVPVSAGAQS